MIQSEHPQAEQRVLCRPVLTPTPGIYRCSACGWANPIPLTRPWVAGCTALSRNLTEPPEPPTLAIQTANFVDAMWQFSKSGCKLTDKPERDRRAKICEACDRFVRGRCTKCGCCGKLKAAGKVWTCPLGKWEEGP